MRAQYRQRNIAISRKAAYETAFLFAEDEEPEKMSPQPELTVETIKHRSSQPSSPISVASAFDMPGEIKPLVLPDSWVVVGKGGKPMKNDKMYNEPTTTSMLDSVTKKKKKRRARSSKADALDAQPLDVTLEEVASSSKCLRELSQSTSRREKQRARAQDTKRWSRYRHDKLLQRAALDELVAALSLATAEEVEEEGAPAQPLRTKKDNKANRPKDKARRRARSAAAAARCALWDDDEHVGGVAPQLEREVPLETRPVRSRHASLSGELLLCFGPHVATEQALPNQAPAGAWTTVGKRGKALNGSLPPRATPKVKFAPAETHTPSNKRAKSAEDSKRGKSLLDHILALF